MKEEKNNNRASLGTVLRSMLSGDILILLRVDRLLPFIALCFILGWINIFLNYKIEQTMVQADKKEKILEDYKIRHAQKTYEYAKLSNSEEIDEGLERMGSDLKAPQKQAININTR